MIYIYTNTHNNIYDLPEVLLSLVTTYFPFNLVWNKANIKGKTNPEVNPTFIFTAFVDLLLMLLKFLLWHSKIHWSEAHLKIRTKIFSVKLLSRAFSLNVISGIKESWAFPLQQNCNSPPLVMFLIPNLGTAVSTPRS